MRDCYEIPRDVNITAVPILFIVFLIFLSGCGSQDGAETPFVKEPDTTPIVQVESSEKKVESTSVCTYDLSSKNWNSIDPTIIEKHSNAERFFAKGGGCVYRPLVDVWAVTHNRLGVKWRDASIDNLRKVEDPSSTLFFEADYSAGPSMFKQKWVIGFLPLFTGKIAEVKTLEIQYQKIRGTKHIVYWKGKIQLQSLSEKVTSVLIENEIEGTQIAMDKAEGAVTDLLNNFRDQLPEWQYLKGL